MPFVIAAAALNLPLMLWRIDGNWLVLAVKALVFCGMYFTLLVLYGFNQSEKQMLLSAINRIRRKKRGKNEH